MHTQQNVALNNVRRVKRALSSLVSIKYIEGNYTNKQSVNIRASTKNEG